jgi:hypothetical protein
VANDKKTKTKTKTKKKQFLKMAKTAVLNF